MKKQTTRRRLLGFLAILPISSIAFASRARAAFGPGVADHNDLDYEGEMMRRLDEGTLSDKYYDFLDRHEVDSIQALHRPEYKKHVSQLTKEFVSDIYNPEGGTLAASSSMSAIPPD